MNNRRVVCNEEMHFFEPLARLYTRLRTFYVYHKDVPLRKQLHKWRRELKHDVRRIYGS